MSFAVHRITLQRGTILLRTPPIYPLPRSMLKETFDLFDHIKATRRDPTLWGCGPDHSETFQVISNETPQHHLMT